MPALVQHEEDEQLTDDEEARPEAVEPAVADLVLRGRRARDGGACQFLAGGGREGEGERRGERSGRLTWRGTATSAKVKAKRPRTQLLAATAEEERPTLASTT